MKSEHVLQDRAKLLAKPNVKEVEKGNCLEVLVFKLSNEIYGIETKFAKEVQPLKDYTPLPCTPAFIFGLINVRRKILTVIDLKVLFGLTAGATDHSKIVIVQGRDREFGLLSDGFDGIQTIPVNKIQTSLQTLTGIREELLRGVTLEGVIILDGDKLLSSKQIIVDEMVEL